MRYAGYIELSVITSSEAKATVEEYVAGLQDTEIKLLAAEDREVVVTAGDLGVCWANPELVEEAVEIGSHGNVIERYKVLKDLEHENKIYPILLSFDLQAISDTLTEKCAKYDREAVNVSLKREDGEFYIVEGQKGYRLDVETSIDLVNDYLTEDWNHQPCTIALDIAVEEPKGSTEELAEVKDVLGSFTTA